ncbi:MAG: daunorubicin/doxorubicin resistance ABC transporter ATP-binding protein DrrA [Micrococcales bacterium]|nr:MAG: daunorubicin/doxorubicin resistance ABC transporter ATP-binding protein DrrA [Micrococcales bacterium]PIE26078.1 MAG: daunorubicin/doxorubicin resistance ABC transporter ATP-binding protein DrrA [Micrococcales bacterium]
MQGSPGPRPALVVENVVKRFGDVTALDGLSFSVARGEVLGMLGPNGAGKTTAINILATLLRPDSGTAVVAGHDVLAQPHEVRSAIALTGQFAAVDEALTGSENLVLFGRLRGLSRSQSQQRSAQLLEEFALTDAAGKLVRTYSGGMRRRLDLAASLVVPAEVVFLDEPTTGLDPRSRNELWDVVRQLRADGLTIVLTTQYLEEADQLAERIIVIDKGMVIAKGTPEELKATAGGSSAVAVPAEAHHLAGLAAALAGIGPTTVEVETGGVVVAGGGSGHLAPIVLRAQEAGIALADVSVRTPSLDDVFLQLTDQGAPQPAEVAS